MSTFVLIPGAGSGPDHWHLIVSLLRAAGHQVVTPDAPCESDVTGLPEYTAAALEATGDRDDLIVVGQSLGGSPQQPSPRPARPARGVEPDVLPAGHAIALARPDALAQQLVDYATQT